MRALIIDDDPFIRTVVRSVLGAAGATADEAANGAEGLAKARANPPDLILCDLDMPMLDGLETLTGLRADPALKHIPFVLITGAASLDTEQRMLRGGAAAVLRKPFPLAALQELIRKYLVFPPAGA